MSCNCGNPWHDKWCPSFIPPPAELCPDGEPCEEQVSTDCVIYTGPDIDCYGITTGMTVTQVLGILYDIIYPNCNTTTTTTTLNPCAICTGFAATPTIACLYGLKIEFLYIATNPDLALLPAGYTHPCPGAIATHNCDRALHEVYMAGHYVGDALMNNSVNDCGAISEYGTPICKDFNNTPAPLTGGVWKGTRFSRYNAIVIDMEEAIEIAAANNNSSIITFDFQHALTKYGAQCQGTSQAHDHEIWVRITRPNGTVIYNDCQTTGTFTVNVCSNIPYTTTTTTAAPTTTTTTAACTSCNTYSVSNTGATSVWVTYKICNSNISNSLFVAAGGTQTVCACTGSVVAPTGSSVTITNTGVCVPTTTTTTI